MIEVEMSKDLRDITPKFLGPFTKRQVLSVCVGFACAVPVFFITGFFINSLIFRLIICVIFMIPAIACGWIDAYGMHLEQFIVFIFKERTQKPAKRLKYSKTIYEEIYDNLPD